MIYRPRQQGDDVQSWGNMLWTYSRYNDYNSTFTQLLGACRLALLVSYLSWARDFQFFVSSGVVSA